jgi:IclR family transcriptional regulator, mhp operon transcriptional activator
MSAYRVVRSLSRGLHLLQELNKLDNASVQELARSTGLTRPTAYRLLETLRTNGYVSRGPSDLVYRLTLKVRGLSAGFHDDAWVIDAGAPILRSLGEKLLWPVALLTFDNSAMSVRETTHRTSPFSIDRGMEGSRVPMLLTASGRAYLAFCPELEREMIFENLAVSGEPDAGLATDREYLERVLHETRRRGYGSRTGGEVRDKTASIALPIMFRERVVACLPIIWIRSAVPYGKAVRQFLEPLRDAAAEIAARLH